MGRRRVSTGGWGRFNPPSWQLRCRVPEGYRSDPATGILVRCPRRDTLRGNRDNLVLPYVALLQAIGRFEFHNKQLAETYQPTRPGLTYPGVLVE